jgi:hypothetical protein
VGARAGPVSSTVNPWETDVTVEMEELHAIVEVEALDTTSRR